MRINDENFGVFQKTGLASLDDLATQEWKQLFSTLETIQEEFLNVIPHTPQYRWPRDPLHTCIRVWEYPFVYSNLLQVSQLTDWNRRLVVDLGSGATFFPFAVSRLGFDVVALDLDIESGYSLNKGLTSVHTGNGSVWSVLADMHTIPLPDKSVNYVYCISVLEHLPDPSKVISEVARVLRQDGRFVLTFDIDLRGNHEIGPDSYIQLRREIDNHFKSCYPEYFIHPLRVLTSDNSPYPYYPKLGTITTVKQGAKRWLLQLSADIPRPERILASTYGICLQPVRA